MANARTPSAVLGSDPAQQGYPSRRTLPQPMDAAQPYVPPPAPESPFVPQMTAPEPLRPGTPGPGQQHFQMGAIPGEVAAHGTKNPMTDTT